MKSQVFTTSATPFLQSTLLAFEKIASKLNSNITFPYWIKEAISIPRTVFALSIALMFLSSSIGYGTTVGSSTNSVGQSYSWITNTPPKQAAETSNTVKPDDKPALPCDENLMNNTVAWLAQCPELAISFAKMANGPLNRKIFNIYTGPPEANQEAQLYTDNIRNIFIENGALNIKALNSPSGDYKYTSARIDTKGKKDFQYGRLEVEAMLPNNVGAWPAIWMLSSNRVYQRINSHNNPTSYLNDGEIDIAESVGTEPNVIYGIAHSLVRPPANYFGTTKVPDSSTQFHKYGIDWTPTRLSFTLDGVEYFSVNKLPNADYKTWPYDQPFYLVINLALGGTWGGAAKASYPPDGVNKNELPFTMKIRSINYYAYKSQ